MLIVSVSFEFKHGCFDRVKEDITNAVEIFRAANCPFELMHCVSTYTMRNKDANINAIKTLQEKYHLIL